MSNQWYIIYNGHQVGPMTVEQMRSYNLPSNTNVWREGMQQWASIYTIPELMNELYQSGNTRSSYNSAASGSYSDSVQPPGYQGNVTSSKDHTTAGILAILLGSLGIQYFYIGKIAAGFLCILLSLISCGLFGIVILVQGILMITMSQQEFERKYVNTSSTMPIF